MVRKMLFECQGYAVLTALSGEDGLKQFDSSAVDAVILDYNMPGMNGAQVAAEMRRRKPAIPIVMLSAYMDLPKNVTRLVDAYVTKGESPTNLLNQLEHVLKARTHHHSDLEGEYIVFADRERRWVEVSDGVCKLLGYSRTELLGRTIDELAAPELKESVPDHFESFMRDGFQRGSYALRHRSGRRVPISYQAKVFPDGCLAAWWEPLEPPPG
jgi:PAS domain S-box-containing protein